MHFEKRVAECGMPVYVCEMPYAQSVNAGVLVRAGTADERWPEEAGMAHALEHMVFHGNAMLENSKAVAASIEETGGGCNAFTDKELTFYYATIPADMLPNMFPRVVPWLYHIVSTPLFLDKNIVTEMPIVIEEIHKRDDEPTDLLQKIFMQAMYGDHPLGRDTLGIAESVSSFSRSHFVSYHERVYHMETFAFIVVGKVKTDEALALVDSYPWPKQKTKMESRACECILREKTVTIFEKADTKQAHMNMGTLIGPANTKETRALRLFAGMLSHGMSSPLFQEVRDKRGLCYSIVAYIRQGSDASVFAVYTGTSPEKSKEAIDVIKRVIQDSMKDEKLFDSAKKMVMGSVKLQYENLGHVLGGAAHDIAFCGAPRSPDEVLKDIEDIAFDDVTRACARYLNVDNFTEAYVAPKGFKL